MSKWTSPKIVDKVTLAFPAAVVGTYLPPASVIPEFEDQQRWEDLVQNLFFRGGHLPPLKEDIDEAIAVRHIKACLSSFEPKHEHKILGVAWLLSLWCEPLPAKGRAEEESTQGIESPEFQRWLRSRW